MPRAKKRARQKKNKAAKALTSQPTNKQDVVPFGSQLCSGTTAAEDCCMAFSPTESPVYGGDELTVTIDSLDLPSDAEFFILYTGSNERRITRAQRINSVTFQGNIPDHILEEEVELDVFCKSEIDGTPDYKRVGNGQFRYHNDSAHSLAKKLLDVNADQEMIKLEVENEDLSTLDTRLKKALEYIAITDGWPADNNDQELNNRDTLLHFAAHHGLSHVVSLVANRFNDETIEATNAQGKTARDLALDQGHKEIADLLSDNSMRSVVKSKSMMFELNGAVVHKNRNGAISIATAHVDGESITSDMDLLNTIEMEITTSKEEQEKTECSEDKNPEGEQQEEAAAVTGEDVGSGLSGEIQTEDISQDNDDITPDMDGKEKADSSKDTPEEEEEKVAAETDAIEEKNTAELFASESLSEDEIVVVDNEIVVVDNDDNDDVAAVEDVDDNNATKADKENVKDNDDDSSTLEAVATEEPVTTECPSDEEEESTCTGEDNTENICEDNTEKDFGEITEESVENAQESTNEKLEILEEELEDEELIQSQEDDSSKTEETIPPISDDAINEVVDSDEKLLEPEPEPVSIPEPEQESESESESKDQSEIPIEDQKKVEIEEPICCPEEDVSEDLDSDASEDEIIDYSQPDMSLSSHLLPTSFETPDEISSLAEEANEPVATEIDESKTDEILNSETAIDLSATNVPCKDTSELISPEVCTDANLETTAEPLLSEAVDSETVRAEPVKSSAEQSPISDESSDSDSSLPLPPSPPPPMSDILKADVVDDQMKANLEEVLLGKDSSSSIENSMDKIAKSEPLSNGHFFQPNPSYSDRSFTGVDNSAASGRVSAGVTGVAYDEIVMRKHQKDNKVDLGPIMGEMCILDPLLEERETSEEPIGKPPMILPSGYLKKEQALGESIEAVRSISRHIQQLRSHGLGLAQHAKGESLQRYGSCPILDIQGRCTPPKKHGDPDHHRSMLDLASRTGHLYSSDNDPVFGSDQNSNIYASDIYASDSNDSGVRICINGVTVESSEDHLPQFTPGSSAASAAASAGTTSAARVSSSIVAEFIKSTGDNSYTGAGDSANFSTATTTSTSAITASSASILGRGKDTPAAAAAAGGGGHGDHSSVGYHKEARGHHRVPSESSQKNFWNHVKSTMASLGSKSHSLSSLTGAADESDEDSYHDARENPTPSQSMMNLSMPPPPDSIYGHHRSATTAENMYIHNTLLQETNRPPSWPLPVRMDHQKIPREMLDHHGLPSKSPLGSDSADEFSSTLPPYSSLATAANQNITKSLSTPCIPAATAIDENKGAASLMKRNNKFYIPNLEDNEKFRRQQEIEEIDEVAEMNKEAVEPRKGREKKELGLTLNEFLNSFPKDDKEKEKKEEKKRRPNVLAKFGSTRKKTKKVKDGKEKENKHRNTHQFVSLSISNTAPCHVCNKSMANKSAVQCENCLVNVHESSCKEQVAPCAKLIKAKPCSQEGTSHGQLREKQFASLPAPSSKALDAMKRSSSVPVRPQGTNTMFHQRHSLPNQGIAEENEDPEQQEHIHSNINETISESMESLDDTSAGESVDPHFLDTDPLLRVEENELEAWSISVDKKVVKKLSSKEVKRQDNIYELIQTEKNYCRGLTIMQKLFFEGLRLEVEVPLEVLNAMFPCLDILLHSHKTFLTNLVMLQSQHKDKIIEELGKHLIENFDGDNAITLKQAYGHFCSHHLEAADIYKEKRVDRKFLSFVKRCANNTICQKREIPDFLLLVTQRLTKYPTLIEAIIKNTKDKKERENLNKALELVKDILTSVNNQVEEYEREQRLSDIYNRTDARSSVLFRSRKFKKSDLRLHHRKLIHDGVIGWKSARGKVMDVIAVVLTDLIVLMQENNQKYTFITQDNKSCVIPLCELLVREKGDTKDGKGIYLITKKNTQPEMYEFVCKSTEDMKNWIVLLRSAVEKCPQEQVVDKADFQRSEVKRILEMRAEKMSKLFESMTHVDAEIVKLCEEKKKQINEYVELYNLSTVEEINTSASLLAQTTMSSTSTSGGTTTSTTSTAPSSSPPSSSSSTVTPAAVATGDKCQSKEEGPEAWEVLQSAMDEITRLTKVLRSIGTCSTPFVGGGTEHLGSSTITHAAPKRAETFAGFDSLDLRKEPTHKRVQSYTHPDGRSSSMFNLNESEAWTSKDATKMNYRRSASYLQNMMAKSPGGSAVEGIDAAGQTVSWAGSVGSSEMLLPTSTSSSSVPSIPDATGGGSTGGGGGSSPSCTSLVSTSAAIANTSDRLSNTVQLSQFLHNFMQLSVQQSTTLEGMRQQLIEAQEKIARLMTEKSEVNKHSQLEGLRNLKEEVTRERQELEQEKKRRAESMETAREEMQKEWNDIRAQKDELQRQREVFQKQYDLWEQHRFNGTAGRSQNLAATEKSPHNLDAHGTNHNPGHSPIMHKRSASAELSSQTPEEYMSSGKDLKELNKQQQHRSSVGNLHHIPIPMQLFSATNEQRVSEKMKQHLPMQLAGSSGNSATLPATGKAQSGISQSQQSGLNRAGLGRSASTASFTIGKESGSLSALMKLAEPCRTGSKERSQSHPQTGISKSDQNSQKQLFF